MMKYFKVSVIVGVKESLSKTKDAQLMSEDTTDDPKSFYEGVFGTIDEETGKFKVNRWINNCQNPFLTGNPNGLDCEHFDIETVSVAQTHLRSVQANLLDNLRQNWNAKFNRMSEYDPYVKVMIDPLTERATECMNEGVKEYCKEDPVRTRVISVMDNRFFRHNLTPNEENKVFGEKTSFNHLPDFRVTSEFNHENEVNRWTQKCSREAFVDNTKYEEGEWADLPYFPPGVARSMGKMVMNLHGTEKERESYVKNFVPALMRSGAMLHQPITVVNYSNSERVHFEDDDYLPEDYTPRPGG